jgi:hypothetical protein
VGRLGTPVPDPTSRQKPVLHIPSPRESAFLAARTRSHARGGGAGNVRVLGWGGGERGSCRPHVMRP